MHQNLFFFHSTPPIAHASMARRLVQNTTSIARLLALPERLLAGSLTIPTETPSLSLQHLAFLQFRSLHTSLSILKDEERRPHRHYKEPKPPKLLQLLPDGFEPPAEWVVPENELHIPAVVRHHGGKKFNKRIRKCGISPSLLHSLPGNKNLDIAVNLLDLQRLAQKYGRESMLSFQYILLLLRDKNEHVPGLDVPKDGVQVVENANDDAQPNLAVQMLPVIMREVHIDGVTGVVENAVFMHLPPGRKTILNIPVVIEGEEDSPAWKKNGSVEEVRDSIPCEVTWDVIPNKPFVIDVSEMDIGARVWVKHLKGQLPGVRIAAQHLMHPVIKMVGKNWKEAAEEEKEAAEA